MSLTSARWLVIAAALLAPLPAQEQGGQDDLLRRATAAEFAGRTEEAATLFLELAEAQPGNLEVAMRAGKLLARVGRHNDAIGLLQSRLDRFPDVPELPTTLARVLLLKAEKQSLHSGAEGVRQYYLAAVELCRDVLATHPDDRDARLMLAQSLYQLGDPEGAAAAAREARERFPQHPGAAVILGRIHLDGARRAKAGEDEASFDEELTAAEDAFDTAVGLDPGRSYAHLMLGEVDLLRDRQEDALGHFKQALVVDPAAPFDHGRLPAMMDGTGRAAFYGGALSGYLARRSPDPEKAAILRWYHGKALLDCGRFGEAHAAFEAALKYRPEDDSARYYAALAAWRMGDRGGALGHTARYASRDAVAFADTVRALPRENRDEVTGMIRQLAAKARKEGRPAACRDLNRVLALVLGTADEWNNYALLCWETGRHREAYEAYLKALEIEPDSPQLLNDAGAVLQHHLATPENLELARSHYERALRAGEAVLADPEASEEAKADARTAMENARKNLAELPDR